MSSTVLTAETQPILKTELSPVCDFRFVFPLPRAFRITFIYSWAREIGQYGKQNMSHGTDYTQQPLFQGESENGNGNVVLV